METKIIEDKDFDWDKYYENGKASLKKELETNSEMWDKWVNPKKRYILITSYILADNNNTILDFCNIFIDSNSVQNLENIWKKLFYDKYDTTKQHFIADTTERKIVKFLSVCM